MKKDSECILPVDSKFYKLDPSHVARWREKTGALLKVIMQTLDSPPERATSARLSTDPRSCFSLAALMKYLQCVTKLSSPAL